MKPRVFLADDSVGGWQWIGPPGTAADATLPRPLADGKSNRSSVRAAVIVPASRMRTLIVNIPPATADKLDSVVRFALEDQLAGDIDLQHVVVADRRPTEALVHVIDRRWLVSALDRLAAEGITALRVVAESDLAPRHPGALATWIHRDDGGFHVERTGKISTLDVAGDALPSGVLRAIEREPVPARAAQPFVVHGPDALRARIDTWSRATGVRFELAPEWAWNDAIDAVIDASPELATPSLRRGANVRVVRARSPWRAAIGWLVAAFLLQAGASAIAWGHLQWRVAKIERDTASAIRAAAPDLKGEPAAAWRAYYADYRHRAGKTAPDDPLPMLADAAEGLREIGTGLVRSITVDGAQLTIDVERQAAATIAAATPRWNRSGFTVLQADTPAGIRIRLARE